MTPAVRIDLGTTNSLAAVVRDGRPEVVRDPAGVGLVPSCLHFAPTGMAQSCQNGWLPARRT